MCKNAASTMIRTLPQHLAKGVPRRGCSPALLSSTPQPDLHGQTKTNLFVLAAVDLAAKNDSKRQSELGPAVVFFRSDAVFKIRDYVIAYPNTDRDKLAE